MLLVWYTPAMVVATHDGTEATPKIIDDVDAVAYSRDVGEPSECWALFGLDYSDFAPTEYARVVRSV